MRFIKKLTAICIAFASIVISLNGFSAKAASNLDGWEKRDDGYYYEINPPITDLFDFHETAEENGQTACDWYIVDYTGDISSKNFAPVSREMFSYGNNVIPVSDVLMAQYDWGMGYCKQGACWNEEYTNETHRYMDFTFKVDFTNINEGCGYIQYVHDNIIVSLQFNTNQIIIQNKESANKWNYTYKDQECYFIDCPGLNALSGLQRITVLIEDRVEKDLTEINRVNNKGALVTVKVGDFEVKQLINKVGYYAGIFGIFNRMNVDLVLHSAKAELTKENLAKIADKNNYSSSVWSEIEPVINQAISSVDSKELSELDALYEDTKTQISKFPTIEEESAKIAKQEEIFTKFANDYLSSEYTSDNWAKVSSLIDEYKTLVQTAKKAKDVAALYKEFLSKVETVFTIADTAEKENILLEIKDYGKDQSYYGANSSEIEEIRAEYIQDIKNAPSIWDVRKLFDAARADIDSFCEISEDVPESESNSAVQKPSDAKEEKKGCAGSISVGGILSATLFVGVFILRKRRD